MAEIAGFKDVAPYLSQPLVLVGFVLFTVLGVQRSLLKARRIPRLTPRASESVVQRLVRYGFVIALLVIVLGFALVLYQTERGDNPAQATSTLKQSATAGDGGTSINTGRDFALGTGLSSSSADRATSSSAEKAAPAASVSQDARTEGFGVAINAGRDANIRK